jgi:Flp pilus assembly protein TadD
VSRRATAGALACALLLVAGGCRSSTRPEVQRLHARAVYEQGQADFEARNVKMALAEFRQAAALDPGNAAYHNALGAVLLYMRTPETIAEAIGEFRKGVAIDDANPDLHQNLGAALAEQAQGLPPGAQSRSRWEEAAAQCRKALALPTLTTPEVAQHNLGWALYNLGRYDEAEGAVRLAVRLNPDQAALSYTLGLILFAEGRATDARAAFQRAQQMDPQSPAGLAAAQYLKALGEGG